MDTPARSITPEQVLENASFVARLARGLVRDPHAADELVQDAWVAALERPPERAGALRGWLGTVVRNLAHNARRGDARRSAREQGAARPERQESHALAVEQLEVQRTLFELVLALPEEKRTVLYLRYYEELGPQAIAARLGIPVKTVKTRHTRALAELRERLDARALGDRRAWTSALLPLVRPRGLELSGATLAGLFGGMAMKTALATVAVLLTAWFVWQGTRGAGSRPADGAAPGRASSTPVASLAGEPAAPATPADPERFGAARRVPESVVVLSAAATTGALVVTLSWSDGTPAAGIGLDASCAHDPAPREERFSTRTDEQGKAQFEALFAGPVRIDLDGGGSFETEVVVGATRELALTVPEGLDVEGRVVDAAGLPVPGAEIWSEGRHGLWPQGALLTRSSADGTFRLRDLDPEASFGARARGHRPSILFQSAGLPVGPLGTRVVTLALDGPGGSVAGRVLDPAGRPLAGARVHAGPRGGFLVDLPDGLQGTSPRPVPVVSDEAGAFVLPNDLEPGVHQLFVVARGYPVREERFEIALGQTSFVEVRLEPPARIEGRVVSHERDPVPDARVLAAREERGYTFHDFPPSEARTDGDGRFALEWIASGARELHASVPDQPRLGKAQALVECAVGTTSACELVLDTGLSITGTVVDAAGRPLAGWNVRGHTDARKGMHRPRSDVTDSDGRFVLANLAEGPCLLVVGGPEEAMIPPRATLEDVQPGDDVEIVVQDAGLETGTFRGRVVGADGSAPQDVAIVVFPEVDRSAGLYVDLDLTSGEFRGEARPGRYRIAVLRGGGTAARSAPFDVLEGAEADAGTIEVETPGSIEVAIPALPAATLERMSFSLERMHGTSRSLVLEDGVLRASGLAPGTWTVSVAENELFLRGSEIEIVAGETTRVEPGVEPGFPVVLQLSGSVPRRVLIDAREPDGTRLVRSELWVDEQDRARICLPAGPAVIDVLTEAGLRGRADVAVGPALRNAAPIEVVLR